METAPAPISYATPLDRPAGPRVWAGAAIAFAGLGLLVIGGCFLIGVMFITSGTFAALAPGGLTANQRALVTVLYTLSVPAFIGGACVLVIGLRGLLRVLHS